MRKISIIYAGSMKEDYFKQAVQEYAKRLSAEFKIDNIEIKEERSLEQEAGKILARLDKLAKPFKIALDREGARLSSEQFAGLLYGEQAINAQSVAFIIGSSHGLAGSVKNRADFRLSFSDMTFPHSLFRVMLMEQIYRAHMIDKGRAYHK